MYAPSPTAPTEEQYARFLKWRALALDRMPYFSAMLFSLRLLNSPGLNTFAVDNYFRLYIDFDGEGVAKHTDKENAQRLLHECMHLMSDHADLAKDAAVTPEQHMVWNVAADMSINDDLDESGCDFFIKNGRPLPEQIAADRGKPGTHYYYILRKMMEDAGQPPPQSGESGEPDPNCPVHGQNQPQPQNDPSDSQKGDDGDQQDEQGAGGDEDGKGGDDQGNAPDGEQSGNGSGDEQGQDGADGAGNGSGGQGGGNGPLDPNHQHSSQGQPCTCPHPPQFKGCGSGAGAEAAPGELGEGDDLGGQAPAALAIEKQRVRKKVADDILQQASRGNVPGNMVDLAKTVLAPSKLPWQTIIAGHMRRAIGVKKGQRDTSRLHTNRRRHDVRVRGGRVIYPGSIEPKITVEAIRDTSGSMSDGHLALVTRELLSIAKKAGIRGREFRITDVDHAVYESKDFKNAAGLVEIQGRGGTDMTIGIRAAHEKKKDRPDVIVVLTDGETPWPTEPTDIPVIAALICPENLVESIASGVPDFIKWVHVDLSDANEGLVEVA